MRLEGSEGDCFSQVAAAVPAHGQEVGREGHCGAGAGAGAAYPGMGAARTSLGAVN